MIQNDDSIVLANYDEIAQRLKDIEEGIYFYLNEKMHPSYLTEGSHAAVLNYLLKGREGVRVTPFILFNLPYTEEDYRRGVIEKALEDHSFPIDMEDAYKQVEFRLTKERLSWNDVVIDIKWEHMNNFVVTKGGVVVPKKKTK